MSAQSIPAPFGIPAYSDNVLYLSMGDRTIPWEFDGWETESLSWKQSCYIHAGLSGWRLDLDGSDIETFLKSICANSFERFPVGSMKHAVMCTEEGLVASHAILQRNAEAHFSLFAAGFPWLPYQVAKSTLDIRMTDVPNFLHQVAGPNSLASLEAAAGESLRDIAFLRFRKAVIAGRPVEIGRIGMAGTLAFEVRGAMDDGPAVYQAVLEAGRPHGMERLGWRTYFVNHIEGGFPQAGWTFFSAGIADPDFANFMGRRFPRMTGSVDPADLYARFRNPFEMGWDRSVRFDHDFIGRDALERAAAKPGRRPVTLRWNAEDALDIHASLLRPGEPYKTVDMPTTPSWQHGFFAHADHLRAGTDSIGFAAGTIYSSYFREILSMAAIDADLAAIGTEVTLLWGDHGKPIKPVRATVGRFPYLSEARNDAVDTAAIRTG